MSEMENSETPEQSRDSISLQLVRAREEKGLSQKEVADELFLTTTFIRYIDEGEFEKIPKPAFIKGYLRSYARVVGLGGDEIVAAFEQEQNIAPQTPRIANVTESADPPSGAGSALIQTGLAGLAALLIVALLVWWIASDDEPPPVVSAIAEDADESPSVAQPDPAPTATQSGERAEVMTPVTGAASAEESTSPAPARVENEFLENEAPAEEVPLNESAEFTATEFTATESTAAEFTATESTGAEFTATEFTATESTAAESTGAESTAADNGSPASEASLASAVDAIDSESGRETDGPGIQIERVSEDGINYISVYAGGETTLEFEFSDECWVEVSDGDGVQVYADLNRSGDVMTIYGKQPFDILLGRAPAVSLTYEGEPVNLRRFTTQDDTARVRTARL